MSTPYPFAGSTSNGSNPRPSVQQYPQRPQQQQQPSVANMASSLPTSQQRGYYAQAPSNSPSTTSLLPPSARGPQAVQATFAQGPKSLRSMPSSSDMVCPPGVLIGIEVIIDALSLFLSRSIHLIQSVRDLDEQLVQCLLYQVIL